MKSLVIFLLLPLQIFAQDITGLWTGFIHTTDKDLPYELAISEKDGQLNGYSHTTFTVNGVEEIGVKAVTIKNKSGTILVEDASLVFNDFSVAPIKGIKQFDYLTLIVEGTKMMLNGTFKTNRIRDYRSINGTIELRKIDTTKRTRIIPKLNELNLLNTLSFLYPKTEEKEVVAVQPAVPEKLKSDIPTKKDIGISAPVAIKERPFAVHPKLKEEQLSPQLTVKEKDLSVTALAKEKKLEIVEQPKTLQRDSIKTELAKNKKEDLTTLPMSKGKDSIMTASKEKKPVIAQQIDIKRKDSIATAAANNKKQDVAIQTKATEKEMAKVTSSVKDKKKESIPLPTQKQVAGAQQPSTKNPQSISLPVEKEKQVASINPAAVKKDDSLRQAIATAASSSPSVIKPKPAPVVSAADLTKRKTEMIQSIFFKTDSVMLSLYDNGEVDGDTVSVVLNGKVVIGSQGLSTNPITKTVYLTPDLGDSLQLVMYAENLGSIPPNTGLLILQDGTDRYEIRFAGDFQKNSAIILRRRRL